MAVFHNTGLTLTAMFSFHNIFQSLLTQALKIGDLLSLNDTYN